MASLGTVRRLNAVDWNFPSSGTPRDSVHRLHWYPGNFIPQIPSALIQILSKPGDLILDPFGGSGTTAVESLSLGRSVCSSDTSWISRQLTEAKIGLIKRELDFGSIEAMVAELTFEQLCRYKQPGKHQEGSSDLLSDWFSLDTLYQLRFLWRSLENFEGVNRQLLEAIFFDTLFHCASTPGARTSSRGERRHHWGWVADNVVPSRPSEHNAIRMFRERCDFILDVAEKQKLLVPDLKCEATVLLQDARALPLENSSVDLVVTSPPYIGMIDYTHASRLSYLWKNMSMLEDRELEIGARYRRNRIMSRREYLDAMNASVAEMRRVLKKNSFCAIVIGESRKFPNASRQVIELFDVGFDLVWGPVERIPTRRRVSDRSASAPSELIVVFQKT